MCNGQSESMACPVGHVTFIRGMAHFYVYILHITGHARLPRSECDLIHVYVYVRRFYT